MKPMPASRMQRADLRRAQLDLDAERAEHVGRARLRRQRAVAVLGDRHAGARDDEGRAGRDIVGAGGVAAGADHVDRVGAAPSRRSILARMAVTAPVISSTVSPRTRSAIRRPPICEGVASPDIMRSKARAASSRVSARAGRDLGDERFEIVGHRHRLNSPRARRLRAGCAAARRVARSRRGEIEKILQHQMAVLGGDAFGMELHAMHRQRCACASPMTSPSSVSAVT